MLVYVKVGESKRFSMEVSEERQQGDWTLSPRGATARGLNAIGTDLIVYRDLCIVCIWEDPTFEIGSSCFQLWLRYAMLVFLVLTCLHWLSFNSLLLVSSDLHRVTCVDRYTSARGYIHVLAWAAMNCSACVIASYCGSSLCLESFNMLAHLFQVSLWVSFSGDQR